MLVTSQDELDLAAAQGAALIEIGARNQFTIRGRYSPEIRIADPAHLCLVIGDKAAPHLILGEGACPILTIRGTAHPLVDIAETAHPTLEIRDSATPRIQLFGAAVARVDCYDLAGPQIEASGASVLVLRCYQRALARVWAHERATIRMQGRGEVFADDGVPVHFDGKANVIGGLRTMVATIEIEEG